MNKMKILETTRNKMKDLVAKYNIPDEKVVITTKVLTTEEAIGSPEHDDYPLVKGKERLMQSQFQGSKGVAFSDMFGNFSANLSEVLNMELKNNFKKAIFVATVNAVLRKLNSIEKTEHCKNNDMIICASRVCEFIKERFGSPKIFLCGLQPRFAEKLSSEFEIKITDMDKVNIGKEFNEVKVMGIEKTDECLNWCSLIFATGSTFVNDTAENLIKSRKNIVFYGVTGAGPTYLLNLKRYCPCSR